MQNLSRDERLLRANEILNSNELKQAICHQILGCTFKDVERAMAAVIRERQVTQTQQEQLELEELAPNKFDPEIEFKVNKQASNNRKEIRYGTYTRDQVAALITASKASSEPETQYRNTSSNYPTLSREECERLVREHFEYKEKEKKNRQELEQWDSLKTTESVKKIANTKKPLTSTKG